jgi:hypothetical protein
LSGGGGILEHVFDIVPPEPEALRGADDEAVVAAIEEWNRIEAAANARRLDAIAELTADAAIGRASGRRGPVTGGIRRRAKSPPRSAPARRRPPVRCSSA